MENTDKVLLGIIAVASVATAINTGITAGTRPQGPVTVDGNGDGSEDADEITKKPN